MTMEFREWLDEAISSANAGRAAKLIRQFLQKKTGYKFAGMPGVEQFSNSSGKGFGIRYFYNGTKSIRFNWSTTSLSSSELDSVDIWDGTRRQAKWSITFDKKASLATILPLIADLLTSSIKPGEYVALPPKTLNEEVEVLSEKYEDAFDGVLKLIKPGERVPIADISNTLSSRGNKVIATLRSSYSEFFTKQGRDVVFSGTASDLNSIAKNKDALVSKMGGVKATIRSSTAGNESYKMKPEFETMDKNIEKIAYEDQLEDLNGLVRLVIKGASNALFVAGRGGVGKTHNVESTLRSMGLSDGAGYFLNTGSASAPGVYRVLFKNKDGVVLFDDSDGALADQDGRNILKAATDTKKVRKIAWNKASKNLMAPDDITDEDIENGKLPTHFEFTGKVIFISNLSIDKLDPDGALRTRALMISIDPSDEELVKFLGKICDKIPLEDGLEMSSTHRREVVDLIAKNGKDLNIRKLVRGLNIRAGAEAAGVGNTWERLIRLYA